MDIGCLLGRHNLDESLYLTDKQYMVILLKIRARVSEDNFRPYCYDSITLGDKFTESNCGLCNEEFTDRETALFPEQFPERTTMKYRRENHKCPFDTREKPDSLGWGIGCFYKCFLFKSKAHSLDVMRAMVERCITEKGCK